MSLGHTGCKRGKRVLVILKSGERLTGKFIERNDRAIRIEGAGWIGKRDVRSFSILR